MTANSLELPVSDCSKVSNLTAVISRTFKPSSRCSLSAFYLAFSFNVKKGKELPKQSLAVLSASSRALRFPRQNQHRPSNHPSHNIYTRSPTRCSALNHDKSQTLHCKSSESNHEKAPSDPDKPLLNKPRTPPSLQVPITCKHVFHNSVPLVLSW